MRWQQTGHTGPHLLFVSSFFFTRKQKLPLLPVDRDRDRGRDRDRNQMTRPYLALRRTPQGCREGVQWPGLGVIILPASHLQGISDHSAQSALRAVWNAVVTRPPITLAPPPLSPPSEIAPTINRRTEMAGYVLHPKLEQWALLLFGLL